MRHRRSGQIILACVSGPRLEAISSVACSIHAKVFLQGSGLATCASVYGGDDQAGMA